MCSIRQPLNGADCKAPSLPPMPRQGGACQEHMPAGQHAGQQRAEGARTRSCSKLLMSAKRPPMGRPRPRWQCPKLSASWSTMRSSAPSAISANMSVPARRRAARCEPTMATATAALPRAQPVLRVRCTASAESEHAGHVLHGSLAQELFTAFTPGGACPACLSPWFV